MFRGATDAGHGLLGGAVLAEGRGGWRVSVSWGAGRGAWAGSGRGSGDHPGAVGAGEAVGEQGAQVEGGAPGVQPGVVLDGAQVAEFDPASVLGGGVGDGAFDVGAGGVVLFELRGLGLGAGGAQQVLVFVDA